ncbi:unnamed protein product [Fraxinus pennsylvanica]|uniref:Peptidase S8/S53 domain-containing protein n=1 Tax=Fraxinus pennsylvanica TaxID=56036 RepID=A0AAD2DZV6_9LAMI|nr:unnamed protein product [Fraxinus pennsylvanica]
MVAPGGNILAAWTGDLGPLGLPTDDRRTKFNILSGTSISCPRVSGIAELLKSKHPDWSPVGIKSALMTTAYTHDNTQNPLIDASKAGPSSPYDHSLIYDIGAHDYFKFLCTQGLEPSQLVVFEKFSNRTCQNSLRNPWI